MTRRTVGILGGMGPLATADLYQKIIRHTAANRDQDHLPVLIYADPSVPDRTEALLSGGEDPTPWLVRGARQLETSGASFIVMPCNTAHAFLESMRAAVEIPIIDMIDEAAREVRSLVTADSQVGILATSGTVAAGLYQAALDRSGLRSAVPDEDGQRLVMETIALVKSGTVDDETVNPVQTAARDLERAGAKALLAACTELPVVLRQGHVTVPLIDPTEVLARAAIRAATDDAVFARLRSDPEKVHHHVS